MSEHDRDQHRLLLAGRAFGRRAALGRVMDREIVAVRAGERPARAAIAATAST